MNTDYSYCSGVTCSIRKSCKRYLPDPPDTRLQWVWPANGFDTPREAFAALIDKVSGKGTWESNPYVWAYEFELMK